MDFPVVHPGSSWGATRGAKREIQYMEKSRVSLPGAPWWPYRNTHTPFGTGLHGELFYLSKEHL